MVCNSRTLYCAGTQAAAANIKPLGNSVHLTLYMLDIGLPDMVRPSMRMAYVIAEMNILTTNCTLCHDHTSLQTF